jgi:hypothetical protein
MSNGFIYVVDAHFIDKIEENKYPGPKCLCAIRDDVFILSSICKETDLYKLSLFPNPCRILHTVLY